MDPKKEFGKMLFKIATGIILPKVVGAVIDNLSDSNNGSTTETSVTRTAQPIVKPMTNAVNHTTRYVSRPIRFFD